MRVRRKLFIMLFLITLSLLTSCNTNDEDPYAGKFGKKIEEDFDGVAEKLLQFFCENCIMYNVDLFVQKENYYETLTQLIRLL